LCSFVWCFEAEVHFLARLVEMTRFTRRSDLLTVSACKQVVEPDVTFFGPGAAGFVFYRPRL
jgi:hypothetical protein